MGDSLESIGLPGALFFSGFISSPYNEPQHRINCGKLSVDN